MPSLMWDLPITAYKCRKVMKTDKRFRQDIESLHFPTDGFGQAIQSLMLNGILIKPCGKCGKTFHIHTWTIL